jgi:hypothetical protein
VWFPGYGWVTFDSTPAGTGTGDVRTSWFWPGRIFFDGLQHRWSKWVLDYSVDEQVGIFAGLLGERTVEAGPSGTEPDTPGPSPWGAVLVVVAILGGVLWARRGGVSFQPATQMYVQLRDACGRAGLAVPPGLTPGTLLAMVRAERVGAARAAERVVDLYLRSRFGRERLGESELREMQEALGVARRARRVRA